MAFAQSDHVLDLTVKCERDLNTAATVSSPSSVPLCPLGDQPEAGVGQVVLLPAPELSRHQARVTGFHGIFSGKQTQPGAQVNGFPPSPCSSQTEVSFSFLH